MRMRAYKQVCSQEISSQASCTPTAICTAIFILHDVAAKAYRRRSPAHCATQTHRRCAPKKLVLQTWQSAPHSTISSESHFFILNKPHVSPQCQGRSVTNLRLTAESLASSSRFKKRLRHFKHRHFKHSVALSPRSTCFQTPPKHQIVRE